MDLCPVEIDRTIVYPDVWGYLPSEQNGETVKYQLAPIMALENNFETMCATLSGTFVDM